MQNAPRPIQLFEQLVLIPLFNQVFEPEPFLLEFLQAWIKTPG